LANGREIENLIQLLSKLPGLGPRSARRAVLYLIKKKQTLLEPLARALSDAANNVSVCTNCGNIDTIDPCTICTHPERDSSSICVVEEVGDLWALERAGFYKGRYHVLGGVLSALDGIGPEDLNIEALLNRVQSDPPREIVLALNATVDGQATAHYVSDRLKDHDIVITRLARGVPVGGELDYLDDGTLAAAFKARQSS